MIFSRRGRESHKGAAEDYRAHSTFRAFVAGFYYAIELISKTTGWEAELGHNKRETIRRLWDHWLEFANKDHQSKIKRSEWRKQEDQKK